MKSITSILRAFIAMCGVVRKFKYSFILPLLFSLLSIQSYAANKTWTNGGGTNNWSDASNWSGGVPGSSDVAIFGSSYTANCNINTQVNISQITIQSGYTGTITQGSGDSIVLSSSYSQSAGTFTGSSANIDVKGSWSLSSGTFTSTSGAMFLGTNFTISSGATFSHNNGTLYFDLSNAATMTFPTGTLNVYNLTFNATVGKNIASNDTVVVNGTLSLLQNQVKGGVIRLVSTSSLTQNSAFTGGTTLLQVSGGLTLSLVPSNFLGLILSNSSATINMPSSGITFDAPVYINSGTFNGGSGSVTIDGNFSQTGGTFTASSGTTTFEGNFSYAGGTFNNNSGTVAFASASNSTFTNGGKITFDNATLNNTSQTVTLTLSSTDTIKTTGTLTLTKGTLNGGYMQLLGTGLSIGSSYYGGTTVMLIMASDTYNIAAGVNVPSITLNNSGATVNLSSGSSPNFTGPLNLMNGTFNCNGSNWTMDEEINLTGGTFNASTGTINYNYTVLNIGSGATFNNNGGAFAFTNSANGTEVYSPVKTQFFDLIINLSNSNPANAILTVPNGDTLLVSDELTLETGSLDSGVIEMTGNLNDYGDFAGGNGTISIDNGSGTRNIYLESEDYPNLNVDDVNAEVYAPSEQAFFVDTFTFSNGDFYPDVYYITCDGPYIQNGGNFWNGIVKETMLDNFIQNGGSFTATSDTLELDGNKVITGSSASFDNNSGITFFNASNNATTVSDTSQLQLYNAIFNLTNSSNSALTVARGDTLVTVNSLILNAGSINTGVVSIWGDLQDDGNFNAGTGTLYFVDEGAGTRNIFLASAVQPNIVVNDSTISLNAPTYQACNFTGTFTLILGNFYPFAYDAYPITFSGNYSQTGGAFWNGEANEYMNGNANITGGTFYGTTDSLEFNGTSLTISSPAVFNHNNGTIYYGGSNNSILSYNGGTLLLYNLSVGYTGATLKPNCPLSMAGNLTIGSSAFLDQSAYGVDVTVGGNLSDLNSSQGLVYGSQTVTFNGSSAQSISGAAGTENFYNLAISNTSGGVTLTSGANGVNAYVYNQLALTPSTGGKIYIGDNNLTINAAASITGGTANEFVVTDATGYLQQENIGPTGRSGSVVFPVGNDAADYTPVTIQNAGTTDRYAVRMSPGMYEDGTTGELVYTGALNQTYNIEEETPGGSNATVTLQFNAGEELSGFDVENCAVMHYTGGQWVAESAYGPASGSGPYTISATGVTHFCPWGGGSGGGGSLPIQLVSFTGFADGNGHVDLDWTTQIEINNNYFTVYRSDDGENYSEFAKVDGAGNSTIQHNYTLTDEHPFNGVNYYKLTQTDFNGNTTNQGVVAVSIGESSSSASVVMYPNPLVGTNLTVEMKGIDASTTGNALITVTDLSGKRIFTGTFGISPEAVITLPSSIAQGVYLVSINTGTNEYRQKLMVP